MGGLGAQEWHDLKDILTDHSGSNAANRWKGTGQAQRPVRRGVSQSRSKVVLCWTRMAVMEAETCLDHE